MELTATMGGPEAANLSWENLVWRARHTATSSKLAPKQSRVSMSITGFGPVKIAEPAPGVATTLHIVDQKSGQDHYLFCTATISKHLQICRLHSRPKNPVDFVAC